MPHAQKLHVKVEFDENKQTKREARGVVKEEEYFIHNKFRKKQEESLNFFFRTEQTAREGGEERDENG